MKLRADRFSIPACILDDGLPDKAFRLLIFLFRCSNIAGMAAPGYRAMQEGADITCRNTVTKSLALLRKHGWFHFVKKGNGRNSVFFLRIPPQYTKSSTKHPLAIRMFPVQKAS